MKQGATIRHVWICGGYRPFLLGQGGNAVLLIHGFTGLPQEMRQYGEYLARQGFRVYAPLLPGHSLSKEKMIKTGRQTG